MHVRTIDRAIRRGDLAAYKPNGTRAVRISRRNLLRWLGLLALILAILVFVLPLRGCESRGTPRARTAAALSSRRRRAVSGVSRGWRPIRPRRRPG